MTHTIQANDTDFQAQTAQGLTLVDFWAPWCGPCLVIAPILEELAQTYAGQVKVVKVNVDENPRSAAQFQVRSIPTMILLRDGVPVDTLVGARPRGVLQTLLDRHLTASPSA